MTPANSIPSKTLLGALSLIIAAFFFAVLGVAARQLEPHFGIYYQLCLRLLISVFAFLIFAKSSRSTVKVFRALSQREKLQILAQTILIFPLGAVTWIAAVQYAPLATVAFITALPTEAVWGSIFYREPLGRLRFFWLAFAVVGLWLIMPSFELFSGHGFGELLALVSSLSFSLGIMLQGRTTAALTRAQSITAVSAIGIVMILALGFLAGESFPSKASSDDLLWLFGAGFVVAINFALLNYGFRQISGALAGTILMLEALFASLAGYYVYSEKLTLSVATGGVLIIASAVGLLIADKRRRAGTH